MKTKLIEALRVVADGIQSEKLPYDWRYKSTCNCGLVACALLDVSPNQLNSRITKAFGNESGSWSDEVGNRCTVTGRPIAQIFKDLESAGLSPRDIQELEYLNNEQVVSAMKAAHPMKRHWFKLVGGITIYKDNPESVIEYMRTWANILERDQQMEAIEDRPLNLNRKEVTP